MIKRKLNIMSSSPVLQALNTAVTHTASSSQQGGGTTKAQIIKPQHQSATSKQLAPQNQSRSTSMHSLAILFGLCRAVITIL